MYWLQKKKKKTFQSSIIEFKPNNTDSTTSQMLPYVAHHLSCQSIGYNAPGHMHVLRQHISVINFYFSVHSIVHEIGEKD